MKNIVTLFTREESRKKVIFTLAALLLIQIGTHIPTYCVNPDYMRALMAVNGTLNLLDAMTGGSMSSMSLFALSITPYITASIIMQLLTVAVPRLERLAKEDLGGREKYEKATYVAAGALGYLEAAAMAVGMGKRGLLLNYTWYNCLIVAFLWGSCAAFCLYIGKQIDKKGIGNGISLILLCNIVSGLPSDLYLLFRAAARNKGIPLAALCIVLAVFIVVGLFAFCVFLNGAEKRIHVQYSRKAAGTASYVQSVSVLPIKVCIAGVMPVIFASSVMSLPSLITTIAGASPQGAAAHILAALNSGNWFRSSMPAYTAGYLVYASLMLFFAYFYVGIVLNPYEVAENLKKGGGTIAGIRPGKPTVEYLERQIKYLVLIGHAGLLCIATIPMVAANAMGLSGLSLGGTSVIIICGVILETREQLEAEGRAARIFANVSGLAGHIIPAFNDMKKKGREVW